MREHWRELEFWRWWWHDRVPPELRAGAIIAALGLALGGGLFAASLLMSSDKTARAEVLYATTDRKLVTVREKGRIVRKVVPVVKVVRLRPSTAFETQTATATRYVTTPGGVRVVEKRVVHYVPVVRKRVVTIAGKTHATSVTVRVPTTRVLTQTQTQTQTQTRTNVVTNQQTVTNTQVTTVHEHDTQTLTQTVTQTQTVTNTQTETQAVTVTVPTTVTIPTTVTVTTTGP